jgi:hypothetical protein
LAESPSYLFSRTHEVLTVFEYRRPLVLIQESLKVGHAEQKAVPEFHRRNVALGGILA